MSTQSKVQSITASVAALAIGAGFSGAASAQESPLAGITSCSAPGGQQTTGALLGAVLGAVAGNSLSKGDKTAGTALGALAGGAAGSWMGCKVARDKADAQYTGYVQAREDLARHPVAYRRAVVEQQRRDRDEADRRYWATRYEQTRYEQPRYAPQPAYGYDRGY